MKQYTLTVVIDEGYNEFWEGLIKDNSTGCDEVLTSVKDALGDVIEDYTVKLTKFTDE